MSKASDAELKSLIETKGWQIHNGFALPPVIDRERGKSQFTLSESRIDSLA